MDTWRVVSFGSSHRGSWDPLWGASHHIPSFLTRKELWSQGCCPISYRTREEGAEM